LAAVAGRSLLRRAVETCSAASSVQRVLVSTDDPEIAREALASGAEVVERPPDLAGDSASSESAVLHALERSEEDGYALPDVTLLVQCTSPFTTAADIDDLVGLIDDHDSAFTGVASHLFLWRPTASGSMDGVNHDASERLPRQQREPEFLETGNAYAMRTAGFLASRHRFFGRIGMLEIGIDRALEIDTPEELDLARALGERRSGTRRPAPSVLAAIDALVFDFDGVLTDDTVVVHEDGTEAVIAHRGDGMGIAALRAAGLPVLILSKERNPVVSARARKLAVEVMQGCDDKQAALSEWLDERGVDVERCAFVGNDVNDLECMAAVGVSVCPADARPEVRAVANWVLAAMGGRGAAREVADTIMAARAQAVSGQTMRGGTGES
jgi:N-acylneuraminate cytidylyltransferase